MMEMNQLISNINLVLLAIPVVLFLLGLLLAVRPEGKGGMNLLQAAKKVWILALVIALVFTLCYAGTQFAEQGLNSQMTISLNYAEASRGLNPNGTRFNTYDILSDAVLEKAIADGNLGNLTPNQLRATLAVEPLAAGSSVSAERYYVSTEYVLSYRASGRTQHLSSTAVIKAVANAFYDSFRESFSRKTAVMTPDFSLLDEADYLDKVELLDRYASDMAEFLRMCSKESKTYASGDGETFSSLSTKINSLRSVELERLNSYILVKGLSVNRDQQLSKFRYLNLMKDINADKNTASYGIHLEAIDLYERDMATVVLIPTRDDDGEFYMSRAKIGVDAFADLAEDFSKTASTAKSTISSNNYAIRQLSGSTATRNEYNTADTMIHEICSNLQALSRKGIDMVTDYDTNVIGDKITFSMRSNSAFSTGSLVKYAIALVVMTAASGFLLAVLVQRSSNRKSTHRRKEVLAYEGF